MRPRLAGGSSFDEEKQRNREERKPAGDEQIRSADVLARRLVQPERRDFGLHQHGQREAHAQQPAHVAERPAVAGDAADLGRRRHVGQKGVVEHVAHLEGDVGDDDQQQREADLALLGKPQRGRRRAAHDGGEKEQPFAVAALVGDGAEHRAQQRHRDRRRRHAVAPERRAGVDLVGEEAGEKGGVDERDDERGEGAVGKVVQRPRPHGARPVLRRAAGRAGRNGQGGHGGRGRRGVKRRRSYARNRRGRDRARTPAGAAARASGHGPPRTLT